MSFKIHVVFLFLKKILAEDGETVTHEIKKKASCLNFSDWQMLVTKVK